MDGEDLGITRRGDEAIGEIVNTKPPPFEGYFHNDGALAAAPVERIVARFPGVRSVAVYAVPDERVGDRVMVAIEADDITSFDVASLDIFIATQPDMGTKWVPSFVRVTNELPKLASTKIDKTRLRRDAWDAPNVWWRSNRGEPLRPMAVSDADDT